MRTRIILIVLLLLFLIGVFHWSRTSSDSSLSHSVETSPNSKSTSIVFLAPRVQIPSSLSANNQTTEPVPLKDLETGLELCLKTLNSQLERAQQSVEALGYTTTFRIPDWLASSEAATPRRGQKVIPASDYEQLALALGRAGLLEGQKFERDEDEAVRLLQQLNERDPQNSAVLLYWALIEKRRGHTEESLALMQKARMEGRHFDSYLGRFNKDLFQKMQTPAELFAAIAIMGTAPIPNYLILKELLREPEDIEFARQLMSSTQTGTGVRDFDWIGLEYSVGRLVDKTIHGETNEPPLSELIRGRGESAPFSVSQVFDDLEKNCSQETLQRWIERIHQALQ